METPPPDVVIARAVRAHTRTLLLLVAIVLVFAVIGTAALSLAGGDVRTPPVLGGISLLGVGQAGALVAATLAALGLVRVLRDVGPPGSEEGSDAVRHQAPEQAVRATAARLAILMRAVVGVAVLAITAWALLEPAGVVGAVVGALVTAQLVVVVAVARVRLLRSR